MEFIGIYLGNIFWSSDGFKEVGPPLPLYKYYHVTNVLKYILIGAHF